MQKFSFDHLTIIPVDNGIPWTRVDKTTYQKNIPRTSVILFYMMAMFREAVITFSSERKTRSLPIHFRLRQRTCRVVKPGSFAPRLCTLQWRQLQSDLFWVLRRASMKSPWSTAGPLSLAERSTSMICSSTSHLILASRSSMTQVLTSRCSRDVQQSCTSHIDRVI